MDCPKVPFFYVHNDYIDHLRRYDSRVMYNKPEFHRRPYVGLCIEINEFDYFIPLSSAKENKGKQTNNTFTTKIKDENGDTIAYAMHQNMIPIKREYVDLMDFDDLARIDPHYFRLLLKEREFIKKNIDSFINKSIKVHRKRDKIPIYKSLCCNFSLLEDKSEEYKEKILITA